VGTTGAIDRLEIEAAGLTFSGRVCGPLDGRRVLLLHGFPQTSWAWHEELEALGDAGYRAIAPDLRGYSPGARPPDAHDYTTNRLMRDVLALANEMDINSFDLVGHDWGGMLAWLVASRHAPRVRSLSVVSTPHPLALQHAMGERSDGQRRGADPEQVARGEATTAYLPSEVPERLLLGPDGSGSGLAALLTDSGLGAEDAQVYVEALTEPGAMTAALNWYRAMDLSTLSGLRPVTVPTLYVWSTGDAAIGRTAAEATKECVSGPYTFEVLEGVSHWVPETASEQLSELLLRHLATA
jgi:pimeloyl-ACP methyl ester carboxylesterase